ncbi:hypothetical protein EDM53_02950 [Rickettsiales endosymbiont of Peranema trichophorum]|uniref:hypothetical protein n=1 Tax=Rickettsiales endosymbiont of Peranema trichophorum TaxID=2486577 RepID=UPI001022ABA3|nr:hypothetical protein [Rickettsiales endosymbiont of Peranema trichophorum]RZI47236.1 hypothetical protein EDM53_02950 [Rickettsiales endosymbiont of Peranema trichophorum]
MSAKEIFQEAMGGVLPDQYSTSCKLTQGQSAAAALLGIRDSLEISLSEAAQEFHICTIGTEDRAASIEQETFEALYSSTIGEAMWAHKPLFFPVSDGHHLVLVGLVPKYPNDPTNKEYAIVYANSMPDDLPGNENNPNSRTGLKFLEALKEYLKTVLGRSADVWNVSRDQQYDECCGLSVASNIAKIAECCTQYSKLDKDLIQSALPALSATPERPQYYLPRGEALFSALRDTKLDYNIAPKQQKVENGIKIILELLKHEDSPPNKSAPELKSKAEVRKDNVEIIKDILVQINVQKHLKDSTNLSNLLLELNEKGYGKDIAMVKHSAEKIKLEQKSTERFVGGSIKS